MFGFYFFMVHLHHIKYFLKNKSTFYKVENIELGFKSKKKQEKKTKKK